jgi:ubiquitin C-terminal hydrolase
VCGCRQTQRLAKNDMFVPQPKTLLLTVKQSEVTYKLVAIVCHLGKHSDIALSFSRSLCLTHPQHVTTGSRESGHYITYGSRRTETGAVNWYLFDDRDVAEVPSFDPSSRASFRRNATPYLVFFEKQ